MEWWTSARRKGQYDIQVRFLLGFSLICIFSARAENQNVVSLWLEMYLFFCITLMMPRKNQTQIKKHRFSVWFLAFFGDSDVWRWGFYDSIKDYCGKQTAKNHTHTHTFMHIYACRRVETTVSDETTRPRQMRSNTVIINEIAGKLAEHWKSN